MPQPETKITRDISVLWSKLKGRAWRNNVGGAWHGKSKHSQSPRRVIIENPRFIKYGVGGEGGSDLIGYTPVQITDEMVGCTIAVFTAIETKGEKTPLEKSQQNFLKAVADSGGIAIAARTIEYATAVFRRAQAGEKVWGMVYGEMSMSRRRQAKPRDKI